MNEFQSEARSTRMSRTCGCVYSGAGAQHCHTDAHRAKVEPQSLGHLHHGGLGCGVGKTVVGVAEQSCERRRVDDMAMPLLD